MSDKDQKMRIMAAITADRNAGATLFDKDGKMRIAAGTNADGTVYLPTENLNPSKP